MKNTEEQEIIDVVKVISQGRNRTNILRNLEQNSIAFFVKKIPRWISSDMLTGIGFSGNILVFLSFILAAYFSPNFLILGVIGFIVSWFGDSLDGRIAYYRNIPRKWYGFALDVTTDWIGIVLICLGFIVYVKGVWEIIGFAFVVLYGWEMITTMIRYKITNQYSIDSGLLGPTEVRIVISGILVLEAFVNGSILYSGSITCVLLFVSNIVDTIKLLKHADIKDIEELKKKKQEDHA
jgi:phosphatidylglycerophosphate synthase